MNKKIYIFIKRGDVWQYAFTTVKHKTCKGAVQSALAQYPNEQFKATFKW